MPESSLNLTSPFLKQIRENPDDAYFRLVYADYIEEQGQDKLAEFIRVQAILEERHWPVLIEMWDIKLLPANDFFHPKYGSLFEENPLEFVRQDYVLQGLAVVDKVLQAMEPILHISSSAIGKLLSEYYRPTYVAAKCQVANKEWIISGYWMGYFEPIPYMYDGYSGQAIGRTSFRTNSYYLDPPDDVKLIQKENELREELANKIYPEVMNVLERRHRRYCNGNGN